MAKQLFTISKITKKYQYLSVGGKKQRKKSGNDSVDEEGTKMAQLPFAITKMSQLT